MGVLFGWARYRRLPFNYVYVRNVINTIVWFHEMDTVPTVREQVMWRGGLLSRRSSGRLTDIAGTWCVLLFNSWNISTRRLIRPRCINLSKNTLKFVCADVANVNLHRSLSSRVLQNKNSSIFRYSQVRLLRTCLFSWESVVNTTNHAFYIHKELILEQSTIKLSKTVIQRHMYVAMHL